MTAIPIATAAAVAARLPGTRPEGAGYRTRGYCHGSQDKPDSASLVFEDPSRPGEQSLHVHCFKCSPRTLAERDAIRHALQKATGLQLCLCPACRQAHRIGRKPPAATNTAPPQQPAHAERRRRQPKQADTDAYAARIWAAAQPSTGPAPHHAAGRWLVDRDLWPAGEPLPDAVRWLSRRDPNFPRGVDGSQAIGALVMAMRRLGDSAGQVSKVQLVAIDKDGRKARHWHRGRDKSTYGNSAAAAGILVTNNAWPHDSRPLVLYVCEGLADGLRLLRYPPRDPQLPACLPVVAATGGHSTWDRLTEDAIALDWWAAIVYCIDNDDQGRSKTAACAAVAHCQRHGIETYIYTPPPGHDPGSTPHRKKI